MLLLEEMYDWNCIITSIELLVTDITYKLSASSDIKYLVSPSATSAVISLSNVLINTPIEAHVNTEVKLLGNSLTTLLCVWLVVVSIVILPLPSNDAEPVTEPDKDIFLAVDNLLADVAVVALVALVAFVALVALATLLIVIVEVVPPVFTDNWF